MKLDIIDDNYIASLKYSYVWKWFLILVFIIYLLKTLNVIELANFYDTFFSFIITIVMIVLLINSFIFTRIGKFEFINNIIITRVNDSIQTVELDTVKTVKISSINKNHYILKFDSDFEVTAEMKNGQLNEIKQLFIQNEVKVIDTSIMNKLKKWFTKQ